MEIILYAFYGLVVLVGLFLFIVYAVSFGIDNSKQVKALRSELKEVKKELKNKMEEWEIDYCLLKQIRARVEQWVAVVVFYSNGSG